jgi:hypothetical protein
MALFSRLEEPIREYLSKDFDTIQIAAQTEDLELFVGAQMSTMKSLKDLPIRNPELNEDIRQTLVNKARGMYVFKCSMDELLANTDHLGFAGWFANWIGCLAFPLTRPVARL